MKGYRLIICYLLVVVALLFWFCSCSPRVITVPEVHTEYVYKTDSFVKRDSIHVKDSVFVHSAGDTVYIEKFKTVYRDRYRDVVRVDSFVRCDSVPYPVVVEKSLTWWQRQKLAFGEYVLVLLSLLVVYVVVRMYFIRKV